MKIRQVSRLWLLPLWSSEGLNWIYEEGLRGSGHIDNASFDHLLFSPAVIILFENLNTGGVDIAKFTTVHNHLKISYCL